MNVFFHTITAVAIASVLTDTRKIPGKLSVKNIIPSGLMAFVLGIISHGALDYIPHCYPINSKADAIISLILILFLTVLTNKSYRPIMASSCVGSVFPDVLDLSSGIINKYVGLNLPVGEKMFPWHWHEYSGSIYSSNCEVSNLNHFLLIIGIAIVLWFRRTDCKAMFTGRRIDND